jgi:hypothetical protein
MGREDLNPMNHNTQEHMTYDYYPHGGLKLSKTLVLYVSMVLHFHEHI